ncbi:MAG: hypothetical protein DMG06_29390 [Acidobacteria bacterium]|nr:MAG: hypothetical protein DMG06_29390 [Acidobacteriota bacterium]
MTGEALVRKDWQDVAIELNRTWIRIPLGSRCQPGKHRPEQDRIEDQAHAKMEKEHTHGSLQRIRFCLPKFEWFIKPVVIFPLLINALLE